MDEFSMANRKYVSSGQKLGIIEGKAYSVSNVFVVRSNQPPLPAASPLARPLPTTSSGITPATRSKSSWFNNRELKRKQRIAKYKLYAVEGRVKSSLKKGYRWFQNMLGRY